MRDALLGGADLRAGACPAGEQSRCAAFPARAADRAPDAPLHAGRVGRRAGAVAAAPVVAGRDLRRAGGAPAVVQAVAAGDVHPVSGRGGEHVHAGADGRL